MFTLNPAGTVYPWKYSAASPRIKTLKGFPSCSEQRSKSLQWPALHLWSYGDSSLCHSAPYILASLLFLRQCKQASASQLLFPAVPFAGNALLPDIQMFVSLLFFRSLLKRNSITENFPEHLIHIKATPSNLSWAPYCALFLLTTRIPISMALSTIYFLDCCFHLPSLKLWAPWKQKLYLLC